MDRSFEGSPIRLGGGGIQHYCMIAAALSRFLHYWVDYYLDCHHCSFLVSFHRRRKVRDVSVLLLGVAELVVCRKGDLEQLEQDPGRRIWSREILHPQCAIGNGLWYGPLGTLSDGPHLLGDLLGDLLGNLLGELLEKARSEIC